MRRAPLLRDLPPPDSLPPQAQELGPGRCRIAAALRRQRTIGGTLTRCSRGRRPGRPATSAAGACAEAPGRTPCILRQPRVKPGAWASEGLAAAERSRCASRHCGRAAAQRTRPDPVVDWEAQDSASTCYAPPWGPLVCIAMQKPYSRMGQAQAAETQQLTWYLSRLGPVVRADDAMIFVTTIPPFQRGCEPSEGCARGGSSGVRCEWPGRQPGGEEQKVGACVGSQCPLRPDPAHVKGGAVVHRELPSSPVWRHGEFERGGVGCEALALLSWRLGRASGGVVRICVS